MTAYTGVPGLAVPGAFVPGLAGGSGPPPVVIFPAGVVTVAPAGPLAAMAAVMPAGPLAATVTITRA